MAGPFDDLIPAGGGTAVADAPAPASDNPFADLIPKADAGGSNNPFSDLVPQTATPEQAQQLGDTAKFILDRTTGPGSLVFDNALMNLPEPYDPMAPGNQPMVTPGKPQGLQEKIRRALSPLLGPTASQQTEGAIAFGKKDAQGNPIYEYKPLAGRPEKEGLLTASYLGAQPLPANPADSTLKATGKAILNQGIGLENALLSPLGVATAGLGSEFPVAGRVISGAFAADMAAHVPGQLDQLANGKTLQDRIEGGLGAVVSLLTAGAAGTHALAGEHPSLDTVISQTRAELDKAVPPSAPLIKEPFHIPDQTLDGLVQARKAAVDGMVNGKVSSETGQPFVDHIDDTLLKVDKDQVKASEERVAARQAQTQLVEGEALPVTPGGPPIQGGRSSLFTRAKEEAGAPPEVTTTPESETPTEPSKIEDPAMHQAALDSAERIATQVTQGQGDIVQRAARDAAYDKIKKNMEGGHPTMSFVRQAAEEAAGKTVKAQPSSLDAETETGKTVGESVPSEALTPVQEAAKADMIDAVQKQVEALPADIQKTAKVFLDAAQNGESTSLRDLGEKLGVSQTTVANHLKKMQQHFTGLKEEGYSVGPGAASISEQIRNSLEPTSLKRAVVDTERLSRGAEPIPTPERQAEAKVVSDAEDRLYNDPTRAKALVARIVDEGDKSISEHDAAELLVERRRVMNERNDWETRLGNGEDVEVAKTRLAEIENELDRLDRAQRAAGTQWGRIGHLYQQEIRDDFSLEGMKRKARAAKQGPLSEDELAAIKKQSEEFKALQDELDKAAQAHADAQLDADTHAAYESAVKGAKEPVDANGQKIDSRILGIAEKIVKGLENQADSALKRIRARRAEGRVNSLPVEDLIDYSIYGAAKIARKGLDFAKWSAEMVKDIGPMSKEVLDEVWKASNKRIDDLSKKTGKDAEKVKSAIKKKAAQTPVEAKAAAKAEAVAGEPLSHQTVYNYVRALIQSGVHGVDALMKAAHEGLKEHFPDLTERDVRRAFSEYGKAKFPSKDAVKVELAETRRITQLQESIDRLKEGQDPLKSGLQRDKATQQIREKQRELNELLKKHAGPPSPEKLASRDQAKQTALRNAIEDLDKELRTGEKAPKGEPVPDSAAVEQLKAERDAMKAKLKEIQDAANPPKSPEEKYNDQRLKQVEKRTAELEAKTKAGDFSKPAKPVPYNKRNAVIEAETKLARAKDAFLQGVEKQRLKNRTKSQKFWDHFVGIERAMKLSSDVVLGKLTTAAVLREGVLTPLEEVVGGGISKIIPRLAARAPREGGLNIAAEIKAKREAFTSGMRDAWDNLRMQRSGLETLYGKDRTSVPSWYDYFGFLHGALKAPVKRAEFARSLEKRMLEARRSGEDINNLQTMGRLAQESYVDAQRSIFMQDNVVADFFSQGFRMLENSKKAPNLGPGLARLGRFLIPIVKVPTNIVGEVATGVHGLISGGARAATAYAKGIESLPKPEADSIMRQLKKGAIGNALLLTGYFGYKGIGGFYQQKENRQLSDVKPGHYRIGNVDLPSFVSHSTASMLLNIGASVRREEIRKGLPSGLGAGVRGTVEQLPFVPAMTNAMQALESDEGFQKYIRDLAAGSIVPAGIAHAAKIEDTPGQFPKNVFTPPNKRYPKTIGQAVESQIPVLRKKVPLHR